MVWKDSCGTWRMTVGESLQYYHRCHPLILSHLSLLNLCVTSWCALDRAVCECVQACGCVWEDVCERMCEMRMGVMRMCEMRMCVMKMCEMRMCVCEDVWWECVRWGCVCDEGVCDEDVWDEDVCVMRVCVMRMCVMRMYEMLERELLHFCTSQQD